MFRIILIIISILIIGSALYFYFTAPKFGDIPAHLLLQAPKEKILKYTEYEDANLGLLVKYLYISDVEVGRATYKGVDESLELRTENTQIFYKSPTEKIYRIYDGQPFYNDGIKWMQTETATTTSELFNQQITSTFWDKVFGTAFAASYYAGAGDGVSQYTNNATWSTVQQATTGTGGSYVTDTDWCGVKRDATPLWFLYRCFFPIDTSAIGSGETISAAVFYFNIVDYVQNDASTGNDYMFVIGSDQPDHTQLTTADYNNCGTVGGWTDGGHTNLSSMTANQYNTITLDATGRGFIKKSGEGATCGTAQTGLTCLGFRVGDDNTDTPSISAGQNNRIYTSFSETTGTGSDPYLEVTTSGASPCTCTPGANWYLDSDDDCYLATSCDLGQEYGLYLLNTGSGAFHIIDGSTLSIGHLESTSTIIDVEPGSYIKFK